MTKMTFKKITVLSAIVLSFTSLSSFGMEAVEETDALMKRSQDHPPLSGIHAKLSKGKKLLMAHAVGSVLSGGILYHSGYNGVPAMKFTESKEFFVRHASRTGLRLINLVPGILTSVCLYNAVSILVNQPKNIHFHKEDGSPYPSYKTWPTYIVGGIMFEGLVNTLRSTHYLGGHFYQWENKGTCPMFLPKGFKERLALGVFAQTVGFIYLYHSCSSYQSQINKMLLERDREAHQLSLTKE